MVQPALHGVAALPSPLPLVPSTTTTDLDVPGSIPPRLFTRHLVKVKVKLGLGSGLETGLGKGRVRVGVSWVCFARHRQQRTSVVREVCNLI